MVIVYLLLAAFELGYFIFKFFNAPSFTSGAMDVPKRKHLKGEQ